MRLFRYKRKPHVRLVVRDALTVAQFTNGCRLIGVDPTKFFNGEEQEVRLPPGVVEAQAFIDLVYDAKPAFRVADLPVDVYEEFMAAAAGFFLGSQNVRRFDSEVYQLTSVQPAWRPLWKRASSHATRGKTL